MFEYTKVTLTTYVKATTLVELLKFFLVVKDTTNWFNMKIMSDSGAGVEFSNYNVSIEIDKNEAMIHKEEFSSLLTIIGFVEPETKEVAFCSSCGAEYDKAITRCLNCDSELVVKKVLANERDRHRII